VHIAAMTVEMTNSRSLRDSLASDAAEDAVAKSMIAEAAIAISDESEDEINAEQRSLVPLRMKVISILLVTAVGFGSHWSSGVTGAMKSTLKKVFHDSHFNED
jgi:hypothetical protein